MPEYQAPHRRHEVRAARVGGHGTAGAAAGFRRDDAWTWRMRCWMRPPNSPPAVLSPLNRSGDLEGVRWQDGRVLTAGRLEASVRALRRRRLERAVLPGGVRRAKSAPRALGAGRGDVERRQRGFCAVPDADAGRDRRHRAARRGGAKETYLAEDGERRMDGDHESHGAAGRLRPVGGAHARRAHGDGRYLRRQARRSSSPTASTTSRTTSCTWCWRALPERRMASKASRCSWCRSSWSMPTVRAGRATTFIACPSSTSSASMRARPACWLSDRTAARSANSSARKIAAWNTCSS